MECSIVVSELRIGKPYRKVDSPLLTAINYGVLDDQIFDRC
jgi:hypothetical protein